MYHDAPFHCLCQIDADPPIDVDHLFLVLLFSAPSKIKTSGTTVAIDLVGDGRQAGAASGVGARIGEIEGRLDAGVVAVSAVLATIAVAVSAAATSAFPFPVLFDSPLTGIGCLCLFGTVGISTCFGFSGFGASLAVSVSLPLFPLPCPKTELS